MIDKRKKERGYMPLAERAKGGREPLANERIVQVGIKMPLSLEQRFIDMCEQLRLKGHRVKKSALIRMLAEYGLPYALDIFDEQEGQNDTPDDSEGAA